MVLTEEDHINQRETCPSVTLSTTNPTWTDLGTKLRGRLLTARAIACPVRYLECLQKNSTVKCSCPTLAMRRILIFVFVLKK
jgi:hypothetical protein